jgi:hypothetical protein
VARGHQVSRTVVSELLKAQKPVCKTTARQMRGQHSDRHAQFSQALLLQRLKIGLPDQPRPRISSDGTPMVK